MKKIAEFMNSPEHCRIYEYLLEYRLYGVTGCEICVGIGREARTPHIYVGEYNISDEVLRWTNYPIVDSSDSENYLSPEATHDYIKHNNMTFDQLKKGIQNTNEDDKEKKYISKAREIGKALNFYKTEVKAIVSCDNCAAPICIYSHKNIGDKGGPNTTKMKQLDKWDDGRHIFGKEVTIELFVMMWKLRCGNYVDSQYYNTLGSAANGGRGDSL